jgi:hypothetical protein
MARSFRLRWRFEYADGKAPRIGPWSRSSKDPKEMAAFVSKENLAFAMIEGEDQASWETEPLAVCAGADFCNFEWIAQASFQSSGGTLPGQIIGLKIRARSETISVLTDGSLNKAERSDDDMKMNLAAYGK